ncbi:YceI family protein [Thioclava sp. FR2]|uniref:YceI family protein n=1 Tax=Thioclava sp. FR2 TaxID=3445780 RepID=UPI003EBD75C6
MRSASVVLCLSVATFVSAQELEPPVAGAYKLDLGHTRLLFRVSHLGFSNYTALFTDVAGDLAFDPDAPEAMKVSAVVKAGSLETHYPDPSLDFNGVITGAEFLDAAQFPEITFVSTGVVLTGEKTADVTGDLTLHGVTKPIVLKVSYNGGWADMPLDVGARIGFSAVGEFNRSDFGVGFGVPAPGSTMGVSDRVEVILEAEFTKARPE